MVVYQSKKAKTFANSYELLLKLVGDLISIQENLNINGNPILEEAFQNNKVSMDILFRKILNLFVYWKDIIAIQEEFDIIGYFNQEKVEEVNEKVKTYL